MKFHREAAVEVRDDLSVSHANNPFMSLIYATYLSLIYATYLSLIYLCQQLISVPAGYESFES